MNGFAHLQTPNSRYVLQNHRWRGDCRRIYARLHGYVAKTGDREVRKYAVVSDSLFVEGFTIWFLHHQREGRNHHRLCLVLAEWYCAKQKIDTNAKQPFAIGRREGSMFARSSPASPSAPPPSRSDLRRDAQDAAQFRLASGSRHSRSLSQRRGQSAHGDRSTT